MTDAMWVYLASGITCGLSTIGEMGKQKKSNGVRLAVFLGFAAFWPIVGLCIALGAFLDWLPQTAKS